MKTRRLVVMGTAAANPFAGMAWMHMQIASGLHRLGHDVYYFEVSSSWPYDPIRRSLVADSDYSAGYLARLAGRFGLSDRWAYRRSYSDGEWLGMNRARAEDLLASADAVFNVSGATRARSREGLTVSRLVWLATDPVFDDIGYVNGRKESVLLSDEHDDVVTYGENIGTALCPIPPLPRLRARTRQPVLLDLWQSGPPTRCTYTTVSNWRQLGRDVVFNGVTYSWSKHIEYEKFLLVPTRVRRSLELAMTLVDPATIQPGPGDVVRAPGVLPVERARLQEHGWQLTDAEPLTTDPWVYRDYVCESRGEFTVAKDQNVRLRTGWFSERSACYLAAGRPVVTQDTGFGSVLPLGEGLFAFSTIDDVVAAFEAIESDYDRHSRAARAIAEEYFRAETVLTRLLQDLSL